MLIIGCGNIGTRMAALCSPDREILAWVRGGSGALKSMPIQALRMDLDHAYDFPDCPPQAQWVYSVPPYQGATDEDERLTRFLASVPEHQLPARLLYFSTSGVYGDHQGDWVSETTVPKPKTKRAKRRLAAEQQLNHWGEQYDVDIIILRVPGIISDETARIKSLSEGEPLITPEESPLSNRVDADFLAKAALTLLSKAPEGIYNIIDRPAKTVTDYALDLCATHGIAVPPFISFDEASRLYSPMRMSFLSESRRLDVRKIAPYVSLPDELLRQLESLPPA